MAADLPVNANICEINDGAYYRVRLNWVPRVGELIDLFSFLDQADAHPAKHYYEVVQVVHQMYDVTEKVAQSLSGYHYVNVYVRPTTSEYLK
jgi:hypothetical protein